MDKKARLNEAVGQVAANSPACPTTGTLWPILFDRNDEILQNDIFTFSYFSILLPTERNHQDC
jgi:hypothetical protein